MTHLTQADVGEFPNFYSPEEIQIFFDARQKAIDLGLIEKFRENRQKIRDHINSLPPETSSQDIGKAVIDFVRSSGGKDKFFGNSFEHLIDPLEEMDDHDNSFIQLLPSPILDTLHPELNGLIQRCKEAFIDRFAKPEYRSFVEKHGTMAISFILGEVEVIKHIDPITGFRLLFPITPNNGVKTYFYDTDVVTTTDPRYKDVRKIDLPIKSECDIKQFHAYAFNHSVLHSCTIKQKEPCILVKWSFNQVFDLTPFNFPIGSIS